MAKWEVVLTGNEDDLNTLTKLFTERACRVAKHADGNYYLSSNEFASMTQPANVFSKTKDSLLPAINALIQLRDSTFQAVSPGAVTSVSDDGTRSGFVFVSETVALRAHARVIVEGTVIGPDGQVVPSPEPARSQARLRLALGDANVTSALKYWRRCDVADPTLWVNAYKVFEIIREDMAGGQDIGRGTEAMKSLGWATGGRDSELQRVRQQLCSQW